MSEVEPEDIPHDSNPMATNHNFCTQSYSREITHSLADEAPSRQGGVCPAANAERGRRSGMRESGGRGDKAGHSCVTVLRKS
jgi:hypothetical protein